MELAPVDDYDPVVFLRCLSAKKGNEAYLDDKTKICKCAFQPAPGGKTTSLLAACGENTICIIDCDAGKSILRYKEDAESKMSKREAFYALAWSTIDFQTADGPVKKDVLAGAGKLGKVYMVDVQGRITYTVARVSKKGISCLAFHPLRSRTILVGAEDKTVSCFDVGSPLLPNYEVDFTGLFSCSAGSNVLNLAVFPRHSLLVCTTETSCLAWHLPLECAEPAPAGREPSNLSQGLRVMCPREAPDTTEWAQVELMVDGLAILDDNTCATKYGAFKCMYVWRVAPVAASCRCVAAEGYSSTRLHKFVPIARLAWCPTGEVYINSYSHPGSGLLVTGDERGRLWLYNVEQFLSKNESKDPPSDCSSGAVDMEKSGNTNEKSGGSASTKVAIVSEPSRLLDWPECVVDNTVVELSSARRPIIVNTVATSHDSKYVVAGTDNNVVCVWRRSSRSADMMRVLEPSGSSGPSQNGSAER